MANSVLQLEDRKKFTEHPVYCWSENRTGSRIKYHASPVLQMGVTASSVWSKVPLRPFVWLKGSRLQTGIELITAV